MQMWQIVANLEFVTGFAIDLQTRKSNISPRSTVGVSLALATTNIGSLGFTYFSSSTVNRC